MEPVQQMRTQLRKICFTELGLNTDQQPDPRAMEIKGLRTHCSILHENGKFHHMTLWPKCFCFYTVSIITGMIKRDILRNGIARAFLAARKKKTLKLRVALWVGVGAPEIWITEKMHHQFPFIEMCHRLKDRDTYGTLCPGWHLWSTTSPALPTKDCLRALPSPGCKSTQA